MAYEAGGTRLDVPRRARPPGAACRLVYRLLPGMARGPGGARRFSDLPAQARTYVQFLEATLDVPVSMVSVGAERNAIRASALGRDAVEPGRFTSSQAEAASAGPPPRWDAIRVGSGVWGACVAPPRRVPNTASSSLLALGAAATAEGVLRGWNG